MLITVSTTHRPATDLGYLLVKHPDRAHSFEVPTGTAHVLYPEASEARCTAALLLDVDPLRLTAARGKGNGRGTTPEGFTLGQYVNDRPYAATSLLASALAKVFRSALRGASKDRPELAATPIPLEIGIPVLRCRGGAELADRLFTPLGWAVTAGAVPLDDQHPEWGDSRYVDLTLTGTVRLADALNHLYVLLPVLDDAKHYWVAPDEIDKLLRAGDGWLAQHPERSLIIRRYLAHRRSLAGKALGRLAELQSAEMRLSDDAVEPDSIDPATSPDANGPADSSDATSPAKRQSLAVQRRAAVLATLVNSGATRVLDLGCGPGALLADLIRDRRYTEIVGTDVSSVTLAMAERRLRLDRLPQRQRDRIKLWQSALTYRDDRLRGFDAAVLMEVVEHVDPPRLPALAGAVFGHAQPATVIVTTPNVEYNVRYEGLAPGAMRHTDHRFEWTREQFAAWADEVGRTYGYQVSISGVGDTDVEVGCPTQLAVFTRSTGSAPAGNSTAGNSTAGNSTATDSTDERVKEAL
ncbi:3' terminal RNA ribose 2'-O-methyltransferase Hen1 [Micromonospora polyrhachis]|uniref:Small RNA 2'-O-methyltransferase n=1 Tax=Micromonospora polyrhachis TaxID=1282883 RepID=A0A7W7WQ02_9ACTN|nr:3' terminal RNA ribose 2'-O-methyltransferase Hen1 [Micromonospora polyrhachis]MBB4958773.1 3' terminal RNA ribose 2'-O-methyltransferase Hen1 [Micromonospora polyrhachis]